MMGSSAIAKRREALILLLKDSESSVRSSAAAALEKLEALQSLDSLLEQLKKGNMVEKVRAIYALGETGGERVIKPLLYCASRPEVELKGAAIDVLGNLAERSTLQVLLNLLKDENSGIRARAIRAVGNFRDPSLVSVLLPFLDSGDGLTDVEALLALCRIGNETLEDKFVNLTSSPIAATREAAATALGYLKSA
jgi:HEAT repeat protein